MSESHPFVRVVKAELRSRGMTYAQLARELGLAESTVKRMMARGELSLTRLDAILAVLKLDATDLARQVVESAPVARELSPEQEAAVVADARVLLVAICALGQWPAQRILSHFTLSQAELTGCARTTGTGCGWTARCAGAPTGRSCDSSGMKRLPITSRPTSGARARC